MTDSARLHNVHIHKEFASFRLGLMQCDSLESSFPEPCSSQTQDRAQRRADVSLSSMRTAQV